MAAQPARIFGDISPEGFVTVQDREYPHGPGKGLPYHVHLTALPNAETFKAAAAVGLNPKNYATKEARIAAIQGALARGTSWSPINGRFEIGAPDEIPTPDEIPEPHETPEIPAPVPQHETPKAHETPKVNDPATDLASAISAALSTATIDPAQVREIAEQVTKDALADALKPQVIVIEIPEREPYEIPGRQHFLFPELVTLASIRVHVWLVGPAGSGKTTVAENVATALGLNFGSISCSPTMSDTRLFGFIDAGGTYHRTMFRECIENGGLFLLDEGDNANPNTLTAVNMALANGVCAFPDGMVKVHPDFVCFVGANTYGTGATRQYIGRVQQDAALTDRFAFVEMPYDEAIEQEVATAILGDSVRAKAWHARVLRFRKNAEDANLHVVIGPRATILGAKVLAAGVSESRAIEMLIRKGMSDEQWAKVNR